MKARALVLPVVNDGVGDGRAGVVVGRGLAGLHKQLGVGDGGGRLDLHVHHLFEVHVNGVPAGVNLPPEEMALVELELEGEGAEAPLVEGVGVLVPEPQRQLGLLRKRAGKGDVDVVMPGNDLARISRCDLVLEDDVLVVLLKAKGFERLSTGTRLGAPTAASGFPADAGAAPPPGFRRRGAGGQPPGGSRWTAWSGCRLNPCLRSDAGCPRAAGWGSSSPPPPSWRSHCT